MQRTKCSLIVVGGLVLVAALALAGCGDDETESTGSDADSSTTTAATGSGELDGTSFESTSATGKDLVPGHTVALSFEDGSMTVVAGCNNLGGSYTVDGDTLSLGADSRSTMMGCEQPLMDQDQWLATWLTAGVTMTTTDAGMSLTGDGVTIEFTKADAAASSALVGPVWTLETVSTAGTASSVPASVQAPTLSFTADSVEVFAGCNTGGAAVTTTADTVTFEAMRLTRMACEDAANALEATVSTTLDGAVGYVIEGNQLTLTNGDTSLTFAGN
jgi:heat shock protein HslJ